MNVVLWQIISDLVYRDALYLQFLNTFTSYYVIASLSLSLSLSLSYFSPCVSLSQFLFSLISEVVSLCPSLIIIIIICNILFPHVTPLFTSYVHTGKVIPESRISGNSVHVGKYEPTVLNFIL